MVISNSVQTSAQRMINWGRGCQSHALSVVTPRGEQCDGRACSLMSKDRFAGDTRAVVSDVGHDCATFTCPVQTANNVLAYHDWSAFEQLPGPVDHRKERVPQDVPGWVRPLP